MCINLWRGHIFNWFPKGMWPFRFRKSLCNLGITQRQEVSVSGSLNVTFCLEHHPSASYSDHFAVFLFSIVLWHWATKRLRLIVQLMSLWGFCREHFPPQHGVFFRKAHGRNPSWASSPGKTVLFFCLQWHSSLLFPPLWTICFL